MNKKCQIFTPIEIVSRILDISGFNSNLYGKKILENSCGDGNVLLEIVRRYIIDGESSGLPMEKIKNGLEKDITAYEIDENKRVICIKRLNELVNKHGICDVRWSIYGLDFLIQDIDEEYDFILGNPPYISYRDLDEETRAFIKSEFVSCKYGKPDYCYPFIEKSIELLSEGGILVYLTPMSIFKNVFAKELRTLMINDIDTIFDYSGIKLFEGVTTSSAIFKVVKGCGRDSLIYNHIYSGKQRNILKELLTDIWTFADLNRGKDFIIGDYFKAQNSVATLRNEIYVFKKYDQDNEFIYLKDHKIERDLIREAGSPKGVSKDERHLILFPYRIASNGDVLSFSEEQLKLEYPYAYKYLLDKKEELMLRKSDKRSQWFEYGRSQALQKLNMRKALISKVVTNYPKVYILSRDCVPYSGIFVYETSDKTLDQFKEMIESDEFYEYVCSVGTNMNGNSIQISTKIIEKYTL